MHYLLFFLIDEIGRLPAENTGHLDSLMVTSHIMETKCKRMKQPVKLYHRGDGSQPVPGSLPPFISLMGITAG
jgi:hypothetical protein